MTCPAAAQARLTPVVRAFQKGMTDEDVKKVIEENKDKYIFKQSSAVQDKYIEKLPDEEIKEFEPKFSDEPLKFFKTSWVIGKFLRGWQMDVPEGHIYGHDANVFLNNVRPQITEKLKKELGRLKNLKFQLALKVLLVKEIDVSKEKNYRLPRCKMGDKWIGKEYSEPVFRHKAQEELLNEDGIDSALDKSYEVLYERIESYMAAGSG